MEGHHAAAASGGTTQQAAADQEVIELMSAAQRFWRAQPATMTEAFTEHELGYFSGLAAEGLLEHACKHAPELAAKIDASKLMMKGAT